MRARAGLIKSCRATELRASRPPPYGLSLKSVSLHPMAYRWRSGSDDKICCQHEPNDDVFEDNLLVAAGSAPDREPFEFTHCNTAALT
jgi:hypothetical protein